MKKTMFRTSLIVVLLLALVGLTVSSFAYWDQTAGDNDKAIVEISEGVRLSVDAEIGGNEGGNLIPEDAIAVDGDVTEVELTYTVKFTKKLANNFDLKVGVANVKIGAGDADASLVNVFIEDVENEKLLTLEADATEITVVVTVTLNMPENNDEYLAVANQKITFTINFEAQRK